MTNDNISIDLNVYVIIFLLIIWTFFVYTIGSLFYECECKYLNLRENLAFECGNNMSCYDSLEEQAFDVKWIENYTRNTT